MKTHIRYFAGAALLGLSQWALALDVPGPVVDGAWLEQNRAEVTVLDVRANPKTFTLTPEFETDKKTGKKFLVDLGGHIDGAVLVDNKKVRMDRSINGVKLKSMIPERADFEKLVRSWGVSAGRPIVIVSAGMEPLDFNDAARLYWQFKVYGEDNIAVLNGGTAGWIAEGRAVSTDAVKATEGNWAAKADRSAALLATSDDLARAQADKSAQLIDARDDAHYLGLSKSSSTSAAGHVPGARNVYTGLMSTQGGDAARLLAADTYRDVFKLSGLDAQASAIAYCNTGHQASGTWFVLSEIVGNKNAKLYDGSMHQWTLEKRPTVAVSLAK
ncbi:sulfurtransferase [Rhodoferax sp. BAB1]|uniref:sulfurtransferase n=1 Tax=Rhodoferax sp. BAB1 TaxID=2741720 RepID=UPI0015751394|nr:rhodanese-like domain-containing protein [Rhodoferax sp. BAB1]QKO20495.1 sulfurtransferase [Rhodoferax sp. BAB1]